MPDPQTAQPSGFDPSKPFSPVHPSGFDPSKPFEPAKSDAPKAETAPEKPAPTLWSAVKDAADWVQKNWTIPAEIGGAKKIYSTAARIPQAIEWLTSTVGLGNPNRDIYGTIQGALKPHGAAETAGSVGTGAAMNILALNAPIGQYGSIMDMIQAVSKAGQAATAGQILRMFPNIPKVATAAGIGVNALINAIAQGSVSAVSAKATPGASGKDAFTMGAVVGGAVGAAQAAAPAIEQSAQTTMAKALGRPGGTGPTNPNLLQTAKDVAPRLLRDNFMATSLPAAADKLQSSLNAANEVLDNAKALSPNQLMDMRPALGPLKAARAALDIQSGGEVIASAESQAKELDGIIAQIQRNPVLKFTDALKLRQVWDKAGQWDKMASQSQNAVASIYRDAANEVRSTIGVNQPSVAAANPDVSHYLDALKVVEKSAERPAQASSIAKLLSVLQLWRSPAGRMVGANLKHDLADALESGDAQKIAQIVEAVGREAGPLLKMPEKKTP